MRRYLWSGCFCSIVILFFYDIIKKSFCFLKIISIFAKKYKYQGMGLKTVIKLGTIMVIALFCMAVGYYAFMQLDRVNRHREVDLFSLMPKSSTYVLESDNVNVFLNELPRLNYNKEIEKLQFPNLFNFLLNGLNEYATAKAHGLSTQMSRMAVSFHAPFTPHDQVVYFGMGAADEKLLEAMLQDYAPTNFLPKEEMYREKSIVIYPLGTEEYLACYSESGFLVISHQKRLIEQVIDAKLDKSSLKNDDVFSSILQQKKTNKLLSLYTRSCGIPLEGLDGNCWSEFNFHTNSDVLYLTGETYFSDACGSLTSLQEGQDKTTFYKAGSIVFSTEKDSIACYMNKVYDKEEDSSLMLFDQCVANLSKESDYTLVVDMQRVAEAPTMYASYLPPYFLKNANLFTSFIFSVQCSLKADGHLSHIWIFTYKD